MHRTQILLEEHQYERLRAEARRTGRSMGELVRAAVDVTYGDGSREQLEEAFRASGGAWSARKGDGAAYVEQLRPGLGSRRAELWD